MAKLGDLFENNPKAAQALVDLVDAIGGVSSLYPKLRENLTPSSPSGIVSKRGYEDPENVNVNNQTTGMPENYGRVLTPKEAEEDAKKRAINIRRGRGMSAMGNALNDGTPDSMQKYKPS